MAEDVLADLGPRFGTQHEAIKHLQQRTAILYSGLTRPSATQDLLAFAQDWWSDRVW